MHPIPLPHLSVLRPLWERRHRSWWAGPGHGMQSSKLLPYQHGDGKQPVCLSFYAAPEVCIIILCDSALELNQTKPGPTIRDLLDTIYYLCEDTWTAPPCGNYRLRELRKTSKLEYPDPDDAPSLWSQVRAEGSCWHTAPSPKPKN